VCIRVWRNEREDKEQATNENLGGGFRWRVSLPLDAKVKEWLIYRRREV
jgi:hypothetical protein